MVSRNKNRPARRSKRRPAAKKPEKQPLRCAIYCRVSTDEQAREGVSLDSQERMCKHYVSIRQEDPSQDRLWQLARVYTDPGYSGKDFERPQIRRLMADIDRGEIDMVVTYKIDRVARSIRHFYDFWEKLEAAGAEVASATQDFNTSTSQGRLMLNMLLSFAQYERELIGERASDGMMEVARQGYCSLQGAPLAGLVQWGRSR